MVKFMGNQVILRLVGGGSNALAKINFFVNSVDCNILISIDLKFFSLT
jgi:siroheme synthase (precorrin-2 oxidase/ferrochelatase)